MLAGGWFPHGTGIPAGSWNTVKVGGGGYVTGIDISSDGATIVGRTDTAGAFIWNPGSGVWENLITAASFAGTALDDQNGGVVEVRVAPSDSSRLYMMFQGDVWKSTNRGVTWTAMGVNFQTRAAGFAEANTGAQRTMGQKLAIDPGNPDIVYMGTNLGVYHTSNGFTTSNLISSGAIAIGSAAPWNAGIAFGIDPSAGVTQTIYVPSYGTGVYLSTNGGSSWSLTSSGPTQVTHAKVAPDGVYYANNLSASTASQWFRYDGSWTNISSGNLVGAASTPGTVIPDITDATGARIIFASGGGKLQLNTNRGVAGSYGAQLSFMRSSVAIPWLEWTNENFMSLGDMVMDAAGKIWFAEGIGVWNYTFSGSPSSPFAWTANTKGIENLTANNVLVAPAPNNKILLVGWDRSVFTISNPQVYPSTHSPNNTNSISMGWHADYASNDPTFVVYNSLYTAPANQFGFSSPDSGVTWTVFSTPTGGTIPITSSKQAGCVAVATSSNFIVVPASDALPWYTKDGGATWTEIVLPGMPTSGVTGWGHSAIPHVSVAADRVNVGTFYLFNYRFTGDGKSPSYTGIQSLFRSTDGGDNWTLMNSASIDTTITDGIVAKLMTVPGQAGHLFLSGGKQGNPGDANPGTSKLMFSKDGGATWARVGAAPDANGTIKEPYTVTVGKEKPGSAYLSVYFGGWLRIAGAYVWGIYRSTDFDPNSPSTATWTSLGTYPTNLSAFKSVDASKESYGLLYAGLGTGASYIYRTAD